MALIAVLPSCSARAPQASSLVGEIARDATIRPSDRPDIGLSRLSPSEKPTHESTVSQQESSAVPTGMTRSAKAPYLTLAGSYGMAETALIDASFIAEQYDHDRGSKGSNSSNDVISSWTGRDKEEEAYRNERVQMRLRDAEPFEHLSFYAEDRTRKPELLLKRALKGAGNFLLNLDLPIVNLTRELGSDIKGTIDYLPDQLGKQARENPWKGSGDVRVSSDEITVGLGETQKVTSGASGIENEVQLEGGVRRVPGRYNETTGQTESFCAIAYTRRF